MFPWDHLNFLTKNLAPVSHGVMNVVLKRLFVVAMSNVRDKPTSLPKRTMLRITLPALVLIMKTQAEIFPSNTKLLANWGHEVNIGKKLGPNWEEGITLLKDFEGMWSGTLG